MSTAQPKMIGTPPRSEWDIAGEALFGVLPPGVHYVPDDRTRFVRLTAVTLNEADKKKRGRPLQFTLDEARAIKRAYWTGEKTITQLTLDFDCTRVTISRIVHGKTYWYA